MAAIFGTILNVVRKIGKPVANAINGVIQSLDADGAGRVSVLNRMRLLNGRGLARADDLLRPLNKGEGYINFLGDNGVSAEEADEAAAVYTAEQARGLNVMLNEIPFYSDDEFTVVLSQSMSISVPPQVSLVQNLCLSPIMNLCGHLVNLARQYRIMRVDAVMLQVMQQNEVYSTRRVAYNPVVTAHDMQEMVTDLERYYADPQYTPVGGRARFFHTDDSTEPIVINGVEYEAGTFRQYVTLQNRIEALPVSKNVDELPERTLGIAQPGMVEVGMRADIASSPVYHPGMEYIGLCYAADFISDEGVHVARDRIMSTMPVYGTFYYTISNQFDKPVDQILTIKYSITCKQRVDGSTYLDPDREPIL